MPTEANSINAATIGIVGNTGTAFTGTSATQYNVLVGGATTSTLSNVAPSATSGVPLISQGAASNPAFGTAVVAGGGTGSTSFNINGVVISNTTTTGALSSLTLSNGQMVIGSTGVSPVAGTISSSDSSITVTTGAGTLSLVVAGGTTVGKTITGNTGGALAPTAGNWNIVGTGSTTAAGSGSTLTVQLTGLTNHNVLVGAGTATVTNVAPSATSGVPLISQGSTSDPAFGTAVVAGGGTGATTLTGLLTGSGTSAIVGTAITQYNVLTGGATNLPNSVAPSATSGVPLISQGSSAQPVFGTAVVAGGGTGATSFTAYSVICGGTTSTGALQNVSGVGTAGQVLTSSGAGALPTWTGAGSLVLIQTQSPSNVATVSFTTGITSTYKTYLFVVSSILPVTNGAQFQMQVSVDGGANYISTNYTTGDNITNYNSTTWANNNTTSFMVFTGGIANTAGGGISGNITLYNITTATPPMAIYQTNEYNANSRICVGSGYNSTTTGVTAFQFSYSSGNVSSGKITLYGVLE